VPSEDLLQPVAHLPATPHAGTVLTHPGVVSVQVVELVAVHLNSAVDSCSFVPSQL
jgi:hypothetical protein